MDPIYLQKQLRENSADLESFYQELKTWGDDMKRKESSQKNQTVENTHATENKKKKKDNNKKVTFTDKPQVPTKIGATDYKAWDKFDADAECEKVDYDENEESDLTDECDENSREEAYVQKEKGNTFVKKQNWDEAINCYTKAINYYSLDPVFYCNRALCHLKKKEYANAETDCSLALKLDDTYTKAYHRRATAREALNKLKEAEQDLVKALEFEPNNKESKTFLENLQQKLTVQRPVSKFTASRSNVKKSTTNVVENVQKNIRKQFDSSKPIAYWPSGDEDIIPVKTVNKPVHLRSKKPLKRIEIQDIDSLEPTNLPEAVKATVIERRQETVSPISTVLKTDDLKVIERKNPDISKETKNITNENVANEKSTLQLVAPKNSVQFYENWRYLRSLEDKYTYLKLIEPQNFGDIFKESMDASVFSSILQVLAEYFTKNSNNVWEYLLGMTRIKRFSTFTMFLTDGDKKYLWKLFDYIEESGEKPKEEVDLLIKKYEL